MGYSAAARSDCRRPSSSSRYRLIRFLDEPQTNQHLKRNGWALRPTGIGYYYPVENWYYFSDIDAWLYALADLHPLISFPRCMAPEALLGLRSREAARGVRVAQYPGNSVSPLTVISIRGRYHSVDTAKLFQSGRSQAVRLPKAYRFSGGQVFVKRIGSAVLLMPETDSWDLMFDACGEFSDDFMADRHQPPHQDRAPLGE